MNTKNTPKAQPPYPVPSDADIVAARRRGQEADVSEARAVAAHYDETSGNLIVTLRGGMTLLIPVHLLQGVAGADPDFIKEVSLRPRGAGLHWEKLDADFSLQGLVAGSFGTAQWMEQLRGKGLLDQASEARLDAVAQLSGFAAQMGRKGGSRRTPAKASAARENGRRGGRPRKLVTT